MRILFLGVGAALNTTYLKTCLLIDDCLLIDVSPEASSRMRQNGRSLNNLQTIAVSHLHADHYFGLPLLLTEYAIDPYVGDHLYIFGPLGLQSVTQNLLACAYPEVPVERFLAKSKARFELLSPDLHFACGNLYVESIPVAHGPIQSFGFLVRSPDCSVFISCDSSLNGTIQKHVSLADFSILDITTDEKRIPFHMNGSDLSALLTALPPGGFAFATHRTFESIKGLSEVFFPLDGQEYLLEKGCRPQLLNG